MTKRVKVAEATNIQLDWLVAACEKVVVKVNNALPNSPYLMVEDFDVWGASRFVEEEDGGTAYRPTTDWWQMGPIIAREIDTLTRLDTYPDYTAQKHSCDDWEDYSAVGPTPLIAAARCYVTSKLGDTVEVPEELT